MATGRINVNTNNQYINGYLEWLANSNVETNTSNLTINVYLHRTNNYSGSPTSNTSNFTKNFYINGELNSSTDYASITIPNDKSYVLVATLTKNNIKHNDDGKLSISIGFEMTNSRNHSSFTIPRVNGNAVFDTIPRTSSFSATNSDIEGNCSIFINRASTTFKHTLRYSFLKLSGIIASDVESGYNWKIPTEFYQQIPDKKSDTCKITCETYSGGTKIGEKQLDITISCNEEKCRPSIEVIQNDINPITLALTGDPQATILDFSNFEIIPTATPKNGTTIKSLTINGMTTNNGERVVINKVTTIGYQIIAEDRRGFKTTISTSSRLINYVKLTCKGKAYRPVQTEDNVRLTVEGNYFNNSFGQEDNIISLSWSYREKGTNEWISGGKLEPVLTELTFSGEIDAGLDFDYRKDYEFLINYEDKLISSSLILPLSKGIFDLEIYDGALLMNGIVLFYDKEKYTQLNNNTFERKI